MLEILVASKPRRTTGPTEFLTSALCHAGVLGLAILATRTTVANSTGPVAVDTTLLFLPRLEAPKVDHPPPPPRRPTPDQVVISANPPPRGFQTIGAVLEVPDAVPPPDLSARALDPRDFTGRGVEGGVGWGVVGGTGSVEDAGEPELKEMLYNANTRDQRFIPAELLTAPHFVYPAVLEEAGVTGRVVVEFVIDTLGRVEPGSIRVLEDSHAAFGRAARAGVLEARFRPAQFGDHQVRQLSRWPVRFSLAAK